MATVRIFDDKLVISAKNQVFVCQADFSQSDLALRALKNINITNLLTETKKPIDEIPIIDKKDQTDKLDKVDQSRIVDTVFSISGNMFAVVTTTKKLLIFETENWTLCSEIHSFPKAATKVLFDLDEKSVFVSQRSGDVHRFYINQKTLDYAEMEPLLGHFSMLLDMCLSPDGSALVTSDRDEKIRVNELPNGVEVRHFLLGHETYVNSVNVHKRYLISSGGDSKIIIWDIDDGQRLLTSSQVCVNPVRKIVLFPTKDFVYLIVLPQRSNELVLLKWDPNEMTIEKIKTLKSARVEEDHPVSQVENTKHLMDVDLDNKTGSIISIGLNGIFLAQITSDSLHPIFVSKEDSGEGINPEWFSAELMFEIQSSTDPFSFEELEKHIQTDNLERYKRARDDKIRKRHSESSEREEIAMKKPHISHTEAQSTAEMAEAVFQEDKTNTSEVSDKKLEEQGEGHKGGVHHRPFPL